MSAWCYCCTSSTPSQPTHQYLAPPMRYAPLKHLQHHLQNAAKGPPFEWDTNLPRTMHDALSENGPCPAFVVGDYQHWRVFCINAKQKSVSYVDPIGSRTPTRMLAVFEDFYDKNDPHAKWQHIEWGHRLQTSHNCRIWSIWLMENWMKYWSQANQTQTFEQWFKQNINPKPKGQVLRYHYHEKVRKAQQPHTDERQTRTLHKNEHATEETKKQTQ